MRKRITALALAFLSALLLMVPCVQPANAAQGDYIAANHARSNGKPYYIMVNRAQSTVTIYGLDENNYYTVPVKAMICSTGRAGHATPLGTYTLGGKWLWVHMLDNSYGQYVSQINGNILFHSVCYTKKDPSTLMTNEYNGLGAPASLGCVRLQTIDAKWIYDNCARGTKITIYDGTSPGPLGKPEKLVSYISDDQASGWDPTDPREANPWHAILAAPASSGVSIWCADAVNWAVEGQIIDGATSGTFLPGEERTQAQVLTSLWRAAGKPDSDAALPIDIAGQDLASAETALRWAAERGMIDKTFDTGAKCTRADAVYYIWQAFGSPDAKAFRFADVPSGAKYAAAVSWAAENGVTNGTAGATFSPNGTCSQAELVTFLHRAYVPAVRLA